MKLFVTGRRKLAVSVAGLATVLLLVAACGSSSNTSFTTPGKSSNTISWALPPNTTVNWIWPFAQLGTNTVTNVSVQAMLWRPLYVFGANGTANVDDALSLAQLPSWNSAGTTATITLKGWKFSDGQTVTSQDVAFDINLYKVETSNDANYTPGYFPDNVASFTTPNSSTIVINFDKPYNQHWILYNQLSQLVPAPTQWDTTNGTTQSDCATNVSDCSAVFNYLTAQAKNLSGYQTNPIWKIVDGPWAMQSFNADGNATFVPNNAYSGPQKAQVKAFKILPFTTDAAEFNVLKSGKTLDYGYIPASDISSPHPKGASALTAGTNPIAPDYKLYPWFLYGFNYSPLNFNGPQGAIISQAYIRQALNTVIDQQGVIDAVAKGYGVPTYGAVPTVPLSNLVSSAEKNYPFAYSIEKASKLLSDNGWKVVKNGTTTCEKPGTASGDCGAGIAAGAPLAFQLPYATGTDTITSFVTDFKSDASQVGINITLRGEPFNTVVGNYSTACAKGSSSCNWTMADWGGGWVYGPDYYPTGEVLFQTGAVGNAGSYSSSTLDGYISQSITSTNSQPFQEYENYLTQQAPVLWTPNFTYALNEVGNGLEGGAQQSPLGFIFPEYWHY